MYIARCHTTFAAKPRVRTADRLSAVAIGPVSPIWRVHISRLAKILLKYQPRAVMVIVTMEQKCA